MDISNNSHIKKISISNPLKTFGLILLPLLLLTSGCTKPPKAPELYWPSPPDAPRIKFIKSINSSRALEKKGFFKKIKEFISGVAEAEALAKPFGIFAKNGKLYVADTLKRVVSVFDFKNLKYNTIGTEGRGRLAKPLAVFVDDSERVYVCDGTAKKILVYDKNFKFIRGVGKRGVMERPGGVVVNEKLNRIYVSDIKKHEIHVFDLKGNKLFSFGQRGVEDGEFNFPTSLAIDKTDGELFIVDSMNFRVQVFDSDGKFVRRFGEVGDQFGNFSRPKGIALDTEGNVYVVDAAFNNIQIFDQKGNLLLFFAGMGYGRGELWLPSGIGIDEKNYIYVADQYNHRVQQYKFLNESEARKALSEEEKKDEDERNRSQKSDTAQLGTPEKS